jgi:prephenate dehydratase
MPLRSDPGNYSFFLDFEGDFKAPPAADVMQQLETMAISIKCLGSYPAHKMQS